MKKCPYCGKEYADDAVRCLVDHELLLDEAPPSAPAGIGVPEPPAQLSTAGPASPMPPAPAVSTERRIRIVEIALVCTIAFGGAILGSTYAFFGGYHGGSDRNAFAWVTQSLREGSALALLWYVLTRRGKSFLDLGLSWARKDAGSAVILIAAAHFLWHAVYAGIYSTGLTAVRESAASANVGRILFGGGITAATILFQFLNPFFEELIVRAYVMTEVKALTQSATKAIVVSTVLQTSYHFYQGAPAAFSDAAMFLVFSIFYAKTNRITPVILAHLFADVNGTLWYWFRH